jgi:hypothetical protein
MSEDILIVIHNLGSFDLPVLGILHHLGACVHKKGDSLPRPLSPKEAHFEGEQEIFHAWRPFTGRWNSSET